MNIQKVTRPISSVIIYEYIDSVENDEKSQVNKNTFFLGVCSSLVAPEDGVNETNRSHFFLFLILGTRFR